MIPKIIHYCWFGKGKMPRLAEVCIRSWRKYCPDYEIKEWNESNFDLEAYPYAAEAYKAKRYAFVTDVVRLYALYHEGGIYMDTDVELLKPLDQFLHHPAFSGFETETQVPTGIMASQKGGKWAEESLQYYENAHFLNENGAPDLTTNVTIISEQMINKGLILNNTYQEIENYFTIYPKDYFCPKDFLTQEIDITPNTACIHHFNMSWHSAASRLSWKVKWKVTGFCSKFMSKKMAEKVAGLVCKIVQKVCRVFLNQNYC